MPAEAPTAPPAAAAAPSSQPAQAAQTTINVSTMPKGDPTVTPPKPGSARSRLSESLHKQFGGESPASPAKPAPDQPASKPGERPTPPARTPEGGAEDRAVPPSSDKPADTTATPPATAKPTTEPDGDKKQRISPWKLVDQYKERATKAESRVLELEKAQLTPEQAKARDTELATLRQQNQAMQEDLRYVRAEKYDPEIVKADSEYQSAYKRAISELSEITFKDPATQQDRALTAGDLDELISLNLARAREVADQLFGPFADDVMAHRKEVKRLFEARAAKLEEIKKTGAERDKKRMEQFQAVTKQTADFIKTNYEQAIKEAMEHPEVGQFFKQRDGDTEWNSRLEKGFKFVDEALSANAMLPSLTPEQRKEVVRKHAALRNRAASWGALRFDNGRLKTRVQELEAKLKEYEEAEPTTDGRTTPSTPKEAPKGMAGLRQSLRKIAKSV